MGSVWTASWCGGQITPLIHKIPNTCGAWIAPRCVEWRGWRKSAGWLLSYPRRQQAVSLARWSRLMQGICAG